MHSKIWQNMGDAEASAVGHQVVAIGPEALYAAAQSLANEPRFPLNGSSISSGEHLAALLLTAFCGGNVPADHDEHGEVDFVMRNIGTRNWILGKDNTAAVEVKSL